MLICNCDWVDCKGVGGIVCRLWLWILDTLREGEVEAR